MGAGGIVVYGETALRLVHSYLICVRQNDAIVVSSIFRGDGNFHGASKIFPEVYNINMGKFLNHTYTDKNRYVHRKIHACSYQMMTQ